MNADWKVDWLTMLEVSMMLDIKPQAWGSLEGKQAGRLTGILPSGWMARRVKHGVTSYPTPATVKKA